MTVFTLLANFSKPTINRYGSTGKEEVEIVSVSRDGACVVWGFDWDEKGVNGVDVIDSSSSSSESDDLDNKKRKRRSLSLTSPPDVSHHQPKKPTLKRLTNGKWSILSRHFLSHSDADSSPVTATALSPSKSSNGSAASSPNLLCVGFESGVFALYEIDAMATTGNGPSVNCLHTLSVTAGRVSSITISPSGDGIALGSPERGQLLVWEWQSESYILKQQVSERRKTNKQSETAKRSERLAFFAYRRFAPTSPIHFSS